MHDFSPFYSPFGPELKLALIPFILALALWTVVVKGYALWHAARAGQRNWFVVLLIINTLGILELIYLIWYRPTSNSEKPAVSSETQG